MALPLRPSSSSSSVSSSVQSPDPDAQQPRRRVSPAQRRALQMLFDAKTHPTKEDRQALADEIGMELKAVSVWFQNRRQTAKKRASVRSPTSNPPTPSLSSSSSSSSSTTLRPTLSLDSIASLSERPTLPFHSRPPLSPRSAGDLLSHMPSSPILPPTSPSVDTARLSVLPRRSKTMRSLEWACAKARAGAGGRENIPPSPVYETDEGTNTDTEVEEAVTPDASAHLSMLPAFAWKGKGKMKGEEGQQEQEFEDVDAAMVLLGFMRQ
ncbi:hypothetical protein PLICRDRAFT_171752 [Plicaturopsis crispa FD-325 SS-3]|nr:hypothetical protein PLICRDRAFT_171752 [Plicaturopsis crispa FD-325 SS-3]